MMIFQNERSVPGSKYIANPWYVAPVAAATAELINPAHHSHAETRFRGPIIPYKR
jgi:hypothetical protein